MKKLLEKTIIFIFTVLLISSCAVGKSPVQAGTLVNTTDELTDINSQLFIQPGAAADRVFLSAVEVDYVQYRENVLSGDTVFSYDTEDLLSYNSSMITGNIDLNEGSVNISEPGVYRLFGVLGDGQVVVDADSKDLVVLILDNVDITSNKIAAINIINADKTVIYLAENSNNILRDSSKTYSSEDADDQEETPAADAVLYSADDLTISGPGSLEVYAHIHNAVAGKDDVLITGGVISIETVGNGIIGKDSLIIHSSNISITAGGDGIKAANEDAGSEGFIAIEDGVFSITAGADGIQAFGSILISNGTFDLETVSGSNTALDSLKAVKAGQDITIIDGKFTVTAADDALHSNQTIHIEGGEFMISSGDDGIHADEAVIIQDGDITIFKSYEGIESTHIFINGGFVDITASDDGINVADGSGAMGGPPEQNRGSSENDYILEINDGILCVNAAGDGIDVNGAFQMAGGEVYVDGPIENKNGAIDYDGSFMLSGGVLAAAGSSGMVQVPSNGSTQNSVLMNYSSWMQAGTEVQLFDAEGTSLIDYTSEKAFQSVLISVPEMETGGSYTLFTDNASAAFKIADVSTWLGESGVTAGNTFSRDRMGRMPERSGF